MIKKITIALWLTMLPNLFSVANAQVPNPALIGYWQNWQNQETPYIQLDQLDPRYNIINISFAIPKRSDGNTYDMEFIPEFVSTETLKSQIQTLQSQGKKVIISIGGATDPVKINTIAERDVFVSSMISIINTYGFDGLDIDLEGSSLSVTGGTIAAPIDQPIIHLIESIRQIMANYYQQYNRKLILTMAPETAYVQGGMSKYTGIWGAYLPVIHALREEIDILHVQLYNSGSMYGIDRGEYFQGTADFIVSQTEAVIQGFNAGTGGHFDGLPESKIAVGLPACSVTSGYTSPETVEAAINYLRGNGPKPGKYTLANPAGYPNLRGMMTWSINWDKTTSCGNVYEFADNFTTIFGTQTTSVEPAPNDTGNPFSFYPNPANYTLTIHIADKNLISKNILLLNSLGKIIGTKTLDNENETIDISTLPEGIYFLKIGEHGQAFIKQ